MSAPLLSVVIPTKDRAGYAVHCLRTLTRLAGDELEIIVQDNSATADLGRLIAEAGDTRVRYEHRPGALSVIENCERGMARARGEYMSLLGDDDGVASVVLDVARWAAGEGVDALVPSRAAFYVWPDVRYANRGDARGGLLTIRPYTGTVTSQDAEGGVRRSLRLAFQNLIDTVDLPKLYYGMIHRRCIEALRQEAGAVFPGVSPDMSAAIGLSKYVRRFVSVDYPVFLGGISAQSTGGAQARKEHVGRLEDQAHLPRNCVATWPIEVPAVFAVETVWAQSGLAALRATGRSELAETLDLGLLDAMIGELNAGYWPAVLPSYWRAVHARGRSRAGAMLDLASGWVRTWALRARYLTGRLARVPWYVGERTIPNLPTIADASTALEAWVAKRGVHLALRMPDRR